jgi:hypothetical protein
MISITAAVTLIVTLIVVGLVFGLLWWLVGYCQLPAPFDRVARVILAIIAVLVLIGVLLQLIGGQSVFKA